jgi:hypothetical protein
MDVGDYVLLMEMVVVSSRVEATETGVVSSRSRAWAGPRS